MPSQQASDHPDARPGEGVESAEPALRSRRWPVWVILGLFLSIALPLIVTGYMGGRGAQDQLQFHWPTVRAFAAEWPFFNFIDYRSATTPGYHVYLATIARFIHDAPRVLQLGSCAITVAMLWVLAWACSRHAPAVWWNREGPVRGWAGAALVLIHLPLITSVYTLSPGIWLQPDNAGWFGVLIAMLIAFRAGRANEFREPDALKAGSLAIDPGPAPTDPIGLSRAKIFAAASATLAVLVLMRQIHIWAAAPIWVGAWASAAPLRDGGLASVFGQFKTRVRGTLPAVAATMPAITILGAFAILWGGLTPPGFQYQHATGFNLATPAFTLTLLAIYSACFGAWIFPTFVRVWREQRWLIFAAAAVGFALGAIPETTYLYEPRGSGLWNLVRKIPYIANHTSPLILVGSTFGAVALCVWAAALPYAQRWVFLAIVLAFTAAQSANSNAWQRYIEPLFLVLLPMITVRLREDRTGIALIDGVLPLGRLLGPLALAAVCALISVRAILFSGFYV